MLHIVLAAFLLSVVWTDQAVGQQGTPVTIPIAGGRWVLFAPQQWVRLGLSSSSW
jgi:hypothetical protein